MPTWTSWTDRGFPESLAGLGRLPQRKIARVIFIVVIHIDTRSVFHSGEVFLGQLAVAGKFRDTEIIRSIFSTIGTTLLLEVGDKLGHLRNMLGRPHQYRLFDIQHRGVLQKRLLVLCSVLLNPETRVRGVMNDFVVHI